MRIVQEIILDDSDRVEVKPFQEIFIDDSDGDSDSDKKDKAKSECPGLPICICREKEVPDGWLRCDGSFLCPSSAKGLFGRIGYSFGKSGDFVPLILPHTGYESASGVVSGSREEGDYYAWKAVDGNPRTFFWSGSRGGDWWQYSFRKPTVVDRIVVYRTRMSAVHFRLLASMDGKTWETLAEEIEIPDTGKNGCTCTYDLRKTGEYKFYRLVHKYSGSGIQFVSVQMFSKAAKQPWFRLPCVSVDGGDFVAVVRV